MEREHGVLYYATGYATIPVHFPNGQVACKHCPGCNKGDTDDGIWKCMYLGGQSMNKSDGKIGTLIDCPIEFIDEVVET